MHSMLVIPAVILLEVMEMGVSYFLRAVFQKLVVLFMSSLLTSVAGFSSLLHPVGTYGLWIWLGTCTDSKNLVIIQQACSSGCRSEQSSQFYLVWMQQTYSLGISDVSSSTSLTVAKAKGVFAGKSICTVG